MSTYQDSYVGGFGQLQKRKNNLPDSNNELICNNCINKELMDAKKAREQAVKDEETPMDVQDRLNELTKTKIYNKVQERIKLSERVAKKMRPQSVEKERLINENEKGTFFLNDPKVLSNDHQRQRALDNYQRRQLMSSSVSKISDKPGVDDYYRKYVDHYKEPEQKKLKSKRLIQQNYNNELENQIAMNQKLKNRADQEAEEKANHEREQENRSFLRAQNEENRKRKQMNDEFLKGNQNLIYLKNRKAENDKLEDAYKQKKSNEQMQQQYQQEEEKKRNIEEEKRRKLQQDLEKQVQEKQRQRELEKQRDRKYVPKNNIGKCSCQGTGVCSECKKTYPLSFLNPKRNYAGLAKEKMNNKRKNNLKY